MGEPQHEFATGGDERCRHCGTPRARHDQAAQPCVPRWSGTEKLMPEPARRTYASEDFDAIGARLVELAKEREAQLDEPAEPQQDAGGCCY